MNEIKISTRAVKECLAIIKASKNQAEALHKMSAVEGLVNFEVWKAFNSLPK